MLDNTPTFRLFMAPTPLQCAAGWLMWVFFFGLVQVTPWRWLQQNTLHGRFALWVYGWAYFWAERAEGRV